MAVRSGKARQDEAEARKQAGKGRRGDRRGGHGKSPFGPKGGRNTGGRGAERRRPKDENGADETRHDDRDPHSDEEEE